jgi:type II secretory pathway pseudopilin PulG
MRQRFRASEGQGVLEILIVAAVFGAALAAFVPTYLGIQGRRADNTAKTHLTDAARIAQTYRHDHGSYRGMDAVDLLLIDPRVSGTVTVTYAHPHGYCLTDTVHGKTWSVRGPYQGKAPFSADSSCD